MANLTGQQVKQVCNALLSGFSKDDLLQLVRFSLNEDLEARVNVAQGLEFVIFRLIEWTEKFGRTAELIRAAALERPDNLQIKAIAVQFLSPRTAPNRSDEVQSFSSPQNSRALHVLVILGCVLLGVFLVAISLVLVENTSDRNTLLAVLFTVLVLLLVICQLVTAFIMKQSAFWSHEASATIRPQPDWTSQPQGAEHGIVGAPSSSKVHYGHGMALTWDEALQAAVVLSGLRTALSPPVLGPEVFPPSLKVLAFQPGRLLRISFLSSTWKKVMIALFSLPYWTVFPALLGIFVGTPVHLDKWGCFLGAALGLFFWARLSWRGPYISIRFDKKSHAIICASSAVWPRGLPSVEVKSGCAENIWRSELLIAGIVVAAESGRSQDESLRKVQPCADALNWTMTKPIHVAEGVLIEPPEARW